MFLDSLVGDAAWRAKYAKDRSGAPMPWALHQAELEATHPYAVFQLRAMLAVPYFEKALCKRCARAHTHTHTQPTRTTLPPGAAQRDPEKGKKTIRLF